MGDQAARRPATALGDRGALPSGDQVLALLRQQWRWEEGDEVAEENEVAALFTLREGRIVRWRPFADRAEARREAGL